MRVLVIGAGAVGTLLGWALATGGAEVTVLRRRRADLRAGSELALTDPRGVRRSVRAAVATDPADLAGAPDLVLCAVKQFDLPGALAALAGWPQAALLTVQNGVGAEAAALAARPSAPLVAGSVTASVAREPDGTVRWLRRGGIGLAAVAGDAVPVRDELVTTFRAAGLAARVYPDWAAMKWSKLVANLVGNATGAILDLEPAAIYADPALVAVERDQLREALAVMRGQGLRPVALPGVPVPLLALSTRLPAVLVRPMLARAVRSARGGKSPSLRLHLASGAAEPTEVDQLNGAVVAAGKRLGVPTPVNAALMAAVRDVSRDPARRAWYRAQTGRLRGGGPP